MSNLRNKIITSFLVGSSLMLACEKSDITQNNPKKLNLSVPEISKTPYSAVISFPHLFKGKDSDISLTLSPSIDVDSVNVRISTDYLNVYIPNSNMDYMVSAGYIQTLDFNHGPAKKSDVLKYNVPLTYMVEGDFSLEALVSFTYKDGDSIKVRTSREYMSYSAQRDSFKLD